MIVLYVSIGLAVLMVVAIVVIVLLAKSLRRTKKAVVERMAAYETLITAAHQNKEDVGAVSQTIATVRKEHEDAKTAVTHAPAETLVDRANSLFGASQLRD